MNHVNVAIAIIHQADRVLICQRRKSDTFGNLWEFPGGKIEPPETPSECLLREIREELDIAIEPIGDFPIIEHAYPNVAVRLMPFLCRIASGVPRPLASQRLEWVKAPRLRDYPFPEANAGLIEQIIDRLSQFATPDAVTIDFSSSDS